MLDIQTPTWELVKQSKLFSDDQLEKIAETPGVSELIQDSPQKLLQWLVDQKRISEYQAQVLGAGLPGPFVFGAYVVRKRVMEGPFRGAFRGNHRLTGHKVALHFMKGDQSSDLDRWQDWLEQIKDYSGSSHSMAKIYHAVDLDSYRFVVSEDFYGTSLIDKLPANGRFPQELAYSVVLDVANALIGIHQRDRAHGFINLNSVMLLSGGCAKLWPGFLLHDNNPSDDQLNDAGKPAWYLAPEIRDGENHPTIKSDLYSLGCLLVRLLGSNPPDHASVAAKDIGFNEKAIGSLAKYDLTGEVLDLIRGLLEHSPDKRQSNLEHIVKTLEALAGRKDNAAFERPDSEPAYLKWLEADDAVQLPGKKVTLDDPNALTTLQAESVSRSQLRSRSPRWMTPLIVSVTAIVLVGLIAWGAYKMGQTTITVENSKPGKKNQTTGATQNGNGISENSGGNTTRTNNGAGEKTEVIPRQPPVIEQVVTVDDGERLWQSPTVGAAINIDLIPPAPRIIFSVRPNELLESEERQRVVQSMGPDFQTFLTQWADLTSLELNDIRHMTISMHVGEGDSYVPCFLIELTDQIRSEELLELLGQPEADSSGEFGSLYRGKNTYYFLPASDNKLENDQLTISRILIGPKEELVGFVNNAPGNSLAGPMLKMSRWADYERHFTVFFVRSALFNSEGQKLMQGPLAKLNRPFDLFLHDSINGVLLSFHLDHGTYLEMMLEHNIDIRTEELGRAFDDSLSKMRDNIIKYVASLSSNEYWNQVKALYPGMLIQMRKEIRTGVEHRHLVANCWLPPTALENLIVASELTLSSTPGVEVAVEKPKVPQSLEELLKTKRSFDIVSQDLINCVDVFKNEINDDFGNLSFPFDIKLIGPDLGADGITQNQRISDFSRTDKPVSVILTDMLFQANPDKNATGPKDPRCKLVWVIAENPSEPGQEIILITTRTAAKNKGWELPPDFQE